MAQKRRSGARHDAEGAIIYWIEQAQHQVRSEVLRAFREEGHEVSAGQWAILLSLWQRDGASHTSLARRSGRDKAGVSRLVDGLQQQGLVTRAADPEDRRTIRVHLTPAGRKLHDRLHPLVDEVAARALAGFSASRRERLRGDLRDLFLNLRPEGERSPSS